MIDNPATVASLLEQMHAYLPIAAFPTREIVRTLRRGGVKASVDRALSVKHVFYAGDEARIACDVTPARGAKAVVLVSLTHLRIAPDHPLFAPVVAYQLERVGRLAATGQALRTPAFRERRSSIVYDGINAGESCPPHAWRPTTWRGPSASLSRTLGAQDGHVAHLICGAADDIRRRQPLRGHPLASRNGLHPQR